MRKELMIGLLGLTVGCKDAARIQGRVADDTTVSSSDLSIKSGTTVLAYMLGFNSNSDLMVLSPQGYIWTIDAWTGQHVAMGGAYFVGAGCTGNPYFVASVMKPYSQGSYNGAFYQAINAVNSIAVGIGSVKNGAICNATAANFTAVSATAIANPGDLTSVAPVQIVSK